MAALVDPRRTAYVGGRILAPDGSLRPGTVVLEGDRIAAVLNAESPVNNAEVIDSTGRTILPGLIDLHFHLTLTGRRLAATESQIAMRSVRQALRTLRAGTTTLRALGGERDLDFGLRELIEQGLVPGPRILTSGRFLHITGGHCAPSGRQADGVDDVRAAVREQLAAGADWIKMMCSGGFDSQLEDPHAPEFTFDEIAAAVEIAGFRGRKVAAHAHSAHAVAMAVRAGAASIEHCSYLDDEAIDLMIANDVFMVPTIAVYEVVGENPGHPLQARSRAIAREKRDTFLRARERGVRWGVGSDGGLGSPFELLLDELISLVELVGLSSREVLAAVTAGNAALLGLDRVGRIEKGCVADLIVIDGDPVADIHDIVRIEKTIARGRVYDWRQIAGPFSLPPIPERPAGPGFANRVTPQRIWEGAYL